MLAEVRSLLDETDSLLKRLEADLDKVDYGNQFAFANVAILRSGGIVERSIKLTMENYCQKRGNRVIANYVSSKIAYMNSFEKEKIKVLLDDFDPNWWPKLVELAGADCLETVDSVKTIRDKIAHGNHNGTSFLTVKNYYRRVIEFPPALHLVVLG